MKTPTSPVVLVVLDGWGFSKSKTGNPIFEARTPTLDMIYKHYPTTLLQASSLAVGMTWGETGNSEVGHLTIGAGRIVEQYRSRIQKLIKNRLFFSNSALTGAFEHAKKNNGRVHISGLLTSGTVHADYSTLLALIEMASEQEAKQVFLHLYLDGRDSGQREGVEILTKLQPVLNEQKNVAIATVIGRNFAMNRGGQWQKTQAAYDLIFKEKGEKVDDILSAVEAKYKDGVTDSDMPALINDSVSTPTIQRNDALIFFNFREDSMQQIFESVSNPHFKEFPVESISDLYIATLTPYVENQQQPFAIQPPSIKNSLAEVISNEGLRQIHLAESEKYAHVTYFFNGLSNGPFQNEKDELFEEVDDLAAQPASRALDIAHRIEEIIEKKECDFVIANFGNADLLAHSGAPYTATKAGIEAVDQALALIYTATLNSEGTLLIVSDHGNAEEVYYRGLGTVETRHNMNPVPFSMVSKKLVGEREEIKLRNLEIAGILADVAPTVLHFIGIIPPQEMTGKNLLDLFTG